MGRPEAACYRPRRDFGGDGHIESLPAASLLFGSGHYPLCRGCNRPPETSDPLGARGCRMLRDKARGALGGVIMPLVGAPPTPRRGLQARISDYLWGQNSHPAKSNNIAFSAPPNARGRFPWPLWLMLLFFSWGSKELTHSVCILTWAASGRTPYKTSEKVPHVYPAQIRV